MDAENIDISLLEEIEAHAIYCAREAGHILLEHFSQPLEVQFKDAKRTDPVTIADRRSEEFLKSTIREKFPQHSILSEEGGTLYKSDSPFVWVLDPLDGTCNFMNGLPFFAVSIGVLWKGQPVAGSIYVPISHHAAAGVYHARLGKGSHLDGEKIEVARESSRRPLSELPPHFGSQFRLSGQSRKEPQEVRNLGSIAVELAMAACGVFQYALFSSPKVWDVAAGILLVKEAGGVAFSRQSRARNWLPLERFQMEPGNEQKAPENLHSWSSPLVVGAPDVVKQVVQDIRSPYPPLSWLTASHRHKSRKDAK